MRRRIAALGVMLVALAICAHGQQPARPPAQFFRLSDLTTDPLQPTIGGGRVVDKTLYAASFFSKDLRCTSSLVGPRTLLTAAHCVGNGESIVLASAAGTSNGGTCDHHPAYANKSDITADYALCGFPNDITTTPYFETVNVDPSLLAQKQSILLTGFGCDKPDGGGDHSGKDYRVGESTIKTLPTEKNNKLVSEGGAYVCLGDSGGPAFLQKGKDGGPRIQVAVNGRGDGFSQSGLPSLSTKSARSFLESWSKQRGTQICGIHRDMQKCRAF